MARKGRQTPTKSVILPYDKTYGTQATKLYALTGNNLIEWQQDLLKPIMAVNEQGKWIHLKFGYAVPRRNGKTESVYAREMWGLLTGENILHTAHRTDTVHSSWERMYDLLRMAGIPIEHFYRASGKEHIYIKGGGRIEYRTRTNSGGLGRGYDLLVIDEAQEYTEAQATALTYITSASKNPQTIYLGTPPTATSAGTKFQEYRENILTAQKLDGGWAEWSVEEQRDPNDKNAWYEANPSIGILISERAVRSEFDGDIVDFNIQRLGLWLVYSQKSEISDVEWKALIPKKMPKLSSRLFVGIKYGIDGANVSMSIAARTASDKIFVEAIDCRPIRSGNTWLLKFLKSADVEKVVIDGASGQELLKNAMREERIKPIPVLPKVGEVISANSLFAQGVEAQTIRHMGQKSLSDVVTNSEKRTIGTKGGFGYRTFLAGADDSLMDSAILAYWACSTTKKKKKKQRVGY